MLKDDAVEAVRLSVPLPTGSLVIVLLKPKRSSLPLKLLVGFGSSAPSASGSSDSVDLAAFLPSDEGGGTFDPDLVTLLDDLVLAMMCDRSCQSSKGARSGLFNGLQFLRQNRHLRNPRPPRTPSPAEVRVVTCIHPHVVFWLAPC